MKHIRISTSDGCETTLTSFVPGMHGYLSNLTTEEYEQVGSYLFPGAQAKNIAVGAMEEKLKYVLECADSALDIIFGE